MDPSTGLRRRHIEPRNRFEPEQSKRSVTDHVKRLDMFPKLQHDSAGSIKTSQGAAVSTVSLVFMVTLFFSEFISYLTIDRTEHIIVDTEIGQTIEIFFDITFPVLPCSAAGVDAMDVTGDQQVNVIKRVQKQRIDRHGKKMGAPVVSADAVPDAEDSLTLSLLRPQLASTEGCIVTGQLEVNKVAGNFHIALGQSHSQGTRHVHHFVMSDIAKYNVTHKINHLSFGKEYDGATYPLDGVDKVLIDEGGGVYQYFIKIIPTIVQDSRGNVLQTNQYSVTDQFKAIPKPELGKRYVPQLPGLFFIYDLSPFMVRVEESSQSFVGFLVNVCAIVGGVFTITGVIDSIVYHVQKRGGGKQFGAVNR